MTLLNTNQLRSHGGTFRRDEAVLSLCGDDVVDFLHRVLCSDVKALEQLSISLSALLTPKSHIVSVLTLIRRTADDDRKMDVVLPLPCEEPRTTLERLVVIDDVEIVRRDDAVLGVYGAACLAHDALAPLAALQDDATRVAEVQLFGASLTAYPDHSLGVAGALLYGAEDAIARIEEHLAQLGFGAIEKGLYDAGRIEAGQPAMGREMGGEVMLLEAGQMGRVSFEKGCYIGQEPVCRTHFRGQVNRRLVGLALAEPVEPNSELGHPDKKAAGRVTSVADPRFIEGDTVPALAYVHRKALDGKPLLLADGREARVVSLPHVELPKAPPTLPKYKD
jgi:folate-binding protein YgfZ